MKLNTISILAILTLNVSTGTVNANTNTSKDLVTDKAATMALIKESLEQSDLMIEKTDFESDLRILLAQKPYMPKPRFIAGNSDIPRTITAPSEE